jgi:hypothetical protein
VALDGANRDVQALSDLGVGEAGAESFEHFGLSGRHPGGSQVGGQLHRL